MLYMFLKFKSLFTYIYIYTYNSTIQENKQTCNGQFPIDRCFPINTSIAMFDYQSKKDANLQSVNLHMSFSGQFHPVGSKMKQV